MAVGRMAFTMTEQIDDYLTDNEVQPKPITKLTVPPHTFLYLEQMIECARYWTPEARLAVGSIVVGQPLQAQGARDVHFVYADEPSAEHDEPSGPPRFYLPLSGMDNNKGYLCLDILGDWNADVNGPAKHALMRMGSRELKLEEQFAFLYEFVRQVASNGFGVSLNQIQRNEGITPLALADLMDAERKLVKRAVDALNTFEGRDTLQAESPDNRRDREQHLVWDEM